LVWIGEHFFPLGDPTNRPRYGKQHREHIHGQAHRLVDQAGIEIDVRIEFALDEVIVAERDPFQLQGDFKQRILAHHVEHLVSYILMCVRAGRGF
jgi:hypothetical protein